ncbi:XRE family transcriptional regulator [uncultured Castellaniella sp.]|uniref:helix-turn-helix domain-containing protein n=1 Tax=uncultured Castellaniella sp. TaxID=647907 RepID=UPI00260EC1C2|nr:XRE family transcriptional regulator [uncultured Castellaniella sp.]
MKQLAELSNGAVSVADPLAPLGEQALATGIGKRLRQRRKVKRLSLREVSAKAGVSIGLLSQIERGISSPSLKSLLQVSEALEMPISWLFSHGQGNGDEPHEPYIVRRSQRRRMDLGAGGMTKDILSPDEINEIQLMRFVLHPGGKSGNSPAQHPTGAKCGTVLSGCLGLEIDGQEHIVKKDDSFAFRASSQYRFWAIGDTDCEVIWATTPALY